MTRRAWLQLAAAGAGHAALFGPAYAQSTQPLGVQLYTVRDKLGPEARATLEAIAAIGYKELEVGRGDLPTLAPLAKSLGLQAVSTHIEAPLVTGDWTAWRAAARQMPMNLPPDKYTLAQALDSAAEHGVKYAVVAYLMETERRGTAEFYEKLADSLSRAGELARGRGVTIGYHNHGFEFEPLPDGRRPLDVLVAGTDPKLVTFELDVFWVGITGANPVALLEQHKGRIALVHLKDKAAEAARATNERNVPPGAFREVGSGTLDFPAILKAARAAGVRHYFVEQDHTPGDPVASLRKSFEYLRRL